MLCRNFELIPIKIEFFMNFKVAPKSGHRPCTIVQDILSKMARREFHFITFFDAYTCSYVV